MDNISLNHNSSLENLISALEQIDTLIQTAMEIKFTEMKQKHIFNYMSVMSDLVSRAKKICDDYVVNQGCSI